MDQKIELQKAINFLHSNRMATIATMHKEGNFPQLALVYYYAGDNHQIYFASTHSSQKITNIIQNDKVALLIGQEVEPLVMQIEGSAHLVTDAALKARMFEKIMDVANANMKSLNFPPLLKLSHHDGTLEVVEVTIDSFKFSDFSDPGSFIYKGTHSSLAEAAAIPPTV